MSNTTRPVNFIHFHGLTLLVVERDGIEYVPARPLCDLAGLFWKGARRTLLTADNQVLYGTAEFEPPEIAGWGTNIGPEKTVHIRLDRGRMFLARINTDRMRSHGNVEAADALLALQIEWAEALHAYEANGVAIKKGHHEALGTVIALIKARAACGEVRERQALTTMLHKACAAMGYPIPEDPQGALPGMS